MSKKATVIFLLSLWALFTGTVSANSPQEMLRGDCDHCGYFEVDCNIAGIHLNLCPKDEFVRREVKTFFGLITTYKEVCAKGELFVGETPLKPVPVPAGPYILLMPSDYVWEKDGPILINISSGEKTYFLLKVFDTRPNRPEDDPGGAGGGGGGGGGGGR